MVLSLSHYVKMLKTDPCKQNRDYPSRMHFSGGGGQGYREGWKKGKKRGRAIKKTSILYDSLSVMQKKKILSSFKDVLCCKTV